LKDGILGSKNKKLLDICLKRIQNEIGLTVSECQTLVAKAANE